MSNEANGANGNGETPAVSPTANDSQDGQNANSSTETQKPEANVPFNENPVMQDYINRQVEKRVKEQLASLPAANPTKNAQEKEDELDLIAREVAAEFDLTIEKAKKLVGTMDRVSGKKVRKLEEDNETLKTQMRFGAVFSTNPDAKQYEKHMKMLFDNMDATEQTFVLKSPSGAEWLYDKAKKMATSGLVSEQQKVAGTSPSGRSTGMNQKLSDATPSKVAQALASGDRDAYNREAAKLFKQ